MAPFAPLTLLAAASQPTRTIAGCLWVATETPKHKTWPAVASTPKKHCNLGQMCKAMVSLLKKLWSAALGFSSCFVVFSSGI